MNRTFKLLVPIALLLLTIFAIGCDKTETKSESAHRAGPNVIVLLVDTLRADYVGTYGGKAETPVIDWLAGQGAQFNKAYAPSSWTVPSVASIFTGMYPQTHGLVEGINLAGQVSKQQRLPDQYTTLAESFRRAGYTTFCITTNSHLSRQHGYNAGFDHFQMFRFSDGTSVEETVETWKDQLQKADDTTGYFLFLHWVDPHHPYDPREPYISKLDPDYLTKLGPLLTESPDILYVKGHFDKFPEHLSLLRDLYASEVSWTDASVGRTLKLLPSVGNSTIVMLSDHGEAFAEHKSMVHGIDLYQETVHVPLILIRPDKLGAGTKVDTPVSLIDVMPTLLSQIGATVPKECEGVDLTPLLKGETIPARPLFSHLDKMKVFRWQAMFDQDLKLLSHLPSQAQAVKALKDGKNLVAKRRLFDLAKNPGETTDLVEKRPNDAKRLAEILGKTMAVTPKTMPQSVSGKMSPEEIEKLKSLGYIGN
jgi:arylsulfatase A-like enzyme